MNKFLSSILVGLFLLGGCGLWNSVLDINDMPEEAPKDLQAKLAWGLWNLDKGIVEIALAEGAQPFDLAKFIKGLPPIPAHKQLSPYAIPLERYLKLVNMVQDVAKIKDSLDRLYPVIESLIRNNISVDQGVTALDGNPSMREFVLRSVGRLQAEKDASGGILDEEGEYALSTLERINQLINPL